MIVDIANNFVGLNNMSAEDRQREYRREMLLASMLIAAGLAISALALTALRARDPLQIAQATPPPQSTPGAETKPSAPSEPGTTGQRPSDVPPQPARPDAGRAEGGRSARAAARAGGEDRAADPREIIPLCRSDCAIAKSWAGETCDVRPDASLCSHVTPSACINLYERAPAPPPNALC